MPKIKRSMLNKLINSNHFQSLAGVAGGAGMAFLSFALLARELTQSEFGKWALFLTILTFVDMLKAGAVQSPMIKYASGESDEEKQKNYATSWQINLGFIAVILFVFLLLSSLLGLQSTTVQFLGVYLAYSVASMPFYYASWIANLDLNFKVSMVLRLVTSASFLLELFFMKMYSELSFEIVAVLYCLSFFAASLVTVFVVETGFKSLFEAKGNLRIKYFTFARYHVLAFLGSNLLKSFDTFIISFILGPISVAFYNVPLRLVEVIELPLKSAINVGFPKFSGLQNNGLRKELNVLIGKYIGVLTLVYLPFMSLLFVFAEQLVLLTGGEQYIDATPIFQIFIVYGLFIPFDRITGVVLDAVGKPKLNSRKVFCMALTNILGDIIVLYFFDSLEPVAMVTVLNVIVGAVVGFYLVSKNIGFKLSDISIGAIKIFKININSKKHTL